MSDPMPSEFPPSLLSTAIRRLALALLLILFLVVMAWLMRDKVDQRLESQRKQMELQNLDHQLKSKYLRLIPNASPGGDLDENRPDGVPNVPIKPL